MSITAFRDDLEHDLLDLLGDESYLPTVGELMVRIFPALPVEGDAVKLLNEPERIAQWLDVRLEPAVRTATDQAGGADVPDDVELLKGGICADADIAVRVDPHLLRVVSSEGQGV